MFKRTFRLIFNNYYLILGIIIGLFMNLTLLEFDCTEKLLPFSHSYNYSTLKTVVKTKNSSKVDITKKPTPIRPRYYSTELGIREKLFVAVLTSEEKLEEQSIHLNATLWPLVDKIRFFMTAPRRNKIRSNNYAHIVAFTDSRQKLRPFQVIKYISDNFLQDYDFYFIANDFNYINGRKLRDTVEKISVSTNVYMGKPVLDASYCNLDAGIIISNSVLKSMKQHLDWCVSHVATSDHSENLGRCIYKSAQIECQTRLQENVTYKAFKVKSFDFAKKFKEIQHKKHFSDSISVYPALQKEQFYLLHAHFAKQKLEEINVEIRRKSENLKGWPPGERLPTVPATRFDLPKQVFLNSTHVFAPDDFTNVRKHSRSESLDLQNILEELKLHLKRTESVWEVVQLVQAYKVFDLGRGMDYAMDILLKSSLTNEETIKRYEISKPLGNAEFLTAPYVTENSKVTILVAVEENQAEKAKTFLETIDADVLQRKDKVLLVFAFLYQAKTPSKGPEDPFALLKDSAVRTSAKYRSEETKVAWVSIRLPNSTATITLKQFPVLRFATVDLCLSKVGVESLILLLSVDATVSTDFLNRVRMNTVSGFQMFSIVPFRFYDPRVAKYNATVSDVNKSNGHFDKQSFEFISFYGRDYIRVRKLSKHLVPLVRSDIDLDALIENYSADTAVDLFEMFVRFNADELHCLRAPDPNLKVKNFNFSSSNGKRNLFLGTRMQLAKFLMDHYEL